MNIRFINIYHKESLVDPLIVSLDYLDYQMLVLSLMYGNLNMYIYSSRFSPRLCSRVIDESWMTPVSGLYPGFARVLRVLEIRILHPPP